LNPVRHTADIAIRNFCDLDKHGFATGCLNNRLRYSCLVIGIGFAFAKWKRS